VVERAHQPDLKPLAGARARPALGVDLGCTKLEAVVLGGGLSQLPHLYTEVPKLWQHWVLSGTLDPVKTRLLPALHGGASGVRGAAWLGRSWGG